MALLKVESDLDKLPLAFSYVREAKALRKQQAAYNPADTAHHGKQVERLFSPEFFAERVSVGSPKEGPIFIVGMPGPAQPF